MIRWLVLLAVCAITLGGYAAALSKPRPIRPKTATTYHYPDFPIGFPGNSSGSIIRNMGLLVDQDPNDSNRTVWSLSFDTANKNWDTDRGMWQGKLVIYLQTVDNVDVYMPEPHAGDDIWNIYGWRDACYYGNGSHMHRQGSWGYPYTDFIRIIHHILPKAIWHGSAIGPC